jgi:hypothetical protein
MEPGQRAQKARQLGQELAEWADRLEDRPVGAGGPPMSVAVRKVAEILFEAAARLRDGQRPLNSLRPGRPQDLLKAFSFGSFVP